MALNSFVKFPELIIPFTFLTAASVRHRSNQSQGYLTHCVCRVFHCSFSQRKLDNANVACLQLLCRAANGLGWAIKNTSNSRAQSNSKQKPPQKALNDLGAERERKREREMEIRTLCERKRVIKSEKRGNQLSGAFMMKFECITYIRGGPTKDGDGKAFLTCKKNEREERKYLNNLLFTDFKVKR